MAKRKKAVAKWTPLVEMYAGDTTQLAGGKKRPFRQAENLPGVRIFKNSRYHVNINTISCKEVPGEEVIWLSIKRLDRRPLHDWRDLQRIKNELCGPECEAVELYPSESRLVDTSNQYHLWVIKSGFRFPFGYTDRHLIKGHAPNRPPVDTPDGTRWVGSRQRPFEEDAVPEDAISIEDEEEKQRDYILDTLGYFVDTKGKLYTKQTMKKEIGNEK